MAKANKGRTYSSFGRGGCFTCDDCGRKTRETGENAGIEGMCPLCAELAMLQNGFSDYGGSDGDRELSLSLRKEILKRGGKLNDGHTWAEEDPLPLTPTTPQVPAMGFREKLGLTTTPDQDHAISQAVAKARKDRSREIAKAAWAPGGCLHKKFRS